MKDAGAGGGGSACHHFLHSEQAFGNVLAPPGRGRVARAWLPSLMDWQASSTNLQSKALSGRDLILHGEI